MTDIEAADEKIDLRSTRPVSYEEFKLYYESAERVTDRRISTNRWNYSVCVAVLGGSAFLLQWSLANQPLLILGGAGAVLLSVAAALFTRGWLRQIENYKALNDAKFSILNQMAPNIRFSGDESSLASFEPLRKEWEELAAHRTVLDVGNRRKISVLDAGRSERFLPQALSYVFWTLAVISIVTLAANWRSSANSFRCVFGSLDSEVCFVTDP